MRTICLLATALSVLAVQVQTVLGQDDELDTLLGSGQEPSGERASPQGAPADSERPRGEGAQSQEPRAAEKPRSAAEPVSQEPSRKQPERSPASAEAEPQPPPATSAAKRSRVIEEIIVTAQKTEQNIREVPISMSVVDDEFIKQQGITDFRDLSLFVPNTKIDNNGTLPNFSIRGFNAHPLNRAFEQAIGLVLDGVPYGTGPYFQTPFFDVNRVEVLRGPQGTLFGKNSTAGIINIATKDPTDEFTGFVDAQLGELDRRRFEAAIGGPLIANFVNFRVAALSDERDGLVENTTARVDPKANSRTNGRDRKGYRVKLGVPDLFGVNLVLGYERPDVFIDGGGSELGIVQPRLIPFYRSWDPNFDAISGNFVSSVDGPEFTNIVGDTFSANASYDLAGWGLDAVGGYSSISYLSVADADLGPAPMLLLGLRDDNPQTTFELRATSPSLPGFYGLERIFGFPLGSTEFTAGFFYQRRLIENSELRLEIDPAVAAQFLAFQNSPEGTPVPPLEDFIGPAVPIGEFGTFDTTQGDEIDTVFFDQTSNAFAGFGQMEWHFLDRWTLQYGMRFSQETKEADWVSVAEQGTGAIAQAALGREQFTQSLDRSEFQFTPKVMLRHDLTDNVNVFAGWVRGFRAGGYNEFTSTGDPEKLEFDPEQVTSWELGAKMELLGGSARFNLGLFWMDLTDFQVLTQNPNDVTFSVENAGEARARGVEVDSTWLPTSWLTLTGSLGFNDSKFLDFPFGTCTEDRQDTDGDGDERCDLSGEPLDFAPKWISAVTANLRFPVSSIFGFLGTSPLSLPGLDLTGGLTMQYQDTHFLDVSVRDPRLRQPSFFRFDGNFGFENLAQGWSLRLVAQNFTDKFTNAIKSDVPLAGGTFYQLPEPPRLVFGELRWAF